MKMNPLLLVVIAFVLERLLCKRWAGGRLLQETWSLDFQAFTVPASASASVDRPSACEYAARHAATDFASSTCGRRNAARSRAIITPAQTRRACWQIREEFVPIVKNAKGIRTRQDRLWPGLRFRLGNPFWNERANLVD